LDHLHDFRVRTLRVRTWISGWQDVYQMTIQATAAQ